MKPLTLLAFASILIATCYATQRCGKRMSAPRGSFESPWYPHPYPPNRECVYIIKSDSMHYINITFEKFKLERPYNGENTDYVTIFDGKENKRLQEVTYNGTQKPPFNFVSMSTVVEIKFISNSLFGFSGFLATYKFMKREGCEPLEVSNGVPDCKLNDEGKAVQCSITCNPTFTLRGTAKTFCQKGDYIEPPSCEADPAVQPSSSQQCNMKEVADFNPVCDEESPDQCTYSCDEHFFPRNNGTLSCVDGEWEQLPECVPDLDKVDFCRRKPEAKKCPFTPEETAKFLEVYIDEMEKLQKVSKQCKMTEVAEFNPVCDEESPDQCTYSCDEHYFPRNNGTLSCVDGEWKQLPECVPDLDKVDFCRRKPEAKKCPFTPEETAKFLEVYIDEMANLQKGSKQCNMKEVADFNPVCDEKSPDQCTYSCDEHYLPRNNGTLSCVDGEWEQLPECVPDLAKVDFCRRKPEAKKCPFTLEETAKFLEVYIDEMEKPQKVSKQCNMTEVAEFNPVCDEESPGQCTYSCDDHYFPINNGTLSCVDGEWEQLPECAPDPDKVDFCRKKPGSKKCPFTPQETAKYLAVYFDEMANLEEIPQRFKCKDCPRIFPCPRPLCFAHRKGFFVRCPAYAKRFQQMYKVSDKKRKLKEMICLTCQAIRCRNPVPIKHFE